MSDNFGSDFMTIVDEAGQTVYEKTAYLSSRVFNEFILLDLQELFPDAGEALKQGSSYRQTLVAYTTSGDHCTVLDGIPFTY